MKKLFMSVAIVLSLLASFIAVPAAAYDRYSDEVENSIDLGVAWLAARQLTDGSWPSWGEPVATTGLAVIKLEDRAWELGYSPFDPEYEYSAHVVAGLNYILAHTYQMNIGLQPAGDPDTNGNGIGAFMSDSLWGGDIHHRNYATGIALMALAGSRDPSRGVTTGPYAGLTYADVVQDTVDWLAWAQNEAVQYRGGWGYQGNEYWSDNSNSGYVVLGLDFAESAALGFSATVPAFVKTELNFWIDYIQNDVTGASGYTHPNQWQNILKTGNLLYQMAFVGDTPDTPRVQAALGYIENMWNHPSSDPGFRPHHYQAMYCLMKGLERMGIDTIDVNGDPEYDWYDELSTIIVDSQLAAGNWPRDRWDHYGPYVLSTCWALLTLEKVVPPSVIEVEIDIKPGSWPNSINLNKRGVTPVAILTTDEFDAATVDPTTVLFGPGEAVPVHWALEDVDDDGDVDLILHFITAEIGLDAESTEATLTGQTYDEMDIVGTDAVRIVPPKGTPRGRGRP